jgi:TetR/AcrR family transcriptional repressor of nem operon
MARVLNTSYEELIERVQEIFWLKGYKGLSVPELSKHLGISQSVLYNKYSKDMLFNDSLDYYTNTYSDPFLSQLRASTEGLKSLKLFFYELIEALKNKTFPKSCLMVNTIVELRNENKDVVDRYDSYLEVLKDSYLVVLNKAYDLGQFKKKESIDDYAEFLLGIIFSMSILYKLNDIPQLRKYIDEQLSFII